MISIISEMFSNKNLKSKLPPFFLSLAMSFLLFIYAPLSLYFTNKNEFWFDFQDIFPVIGLMFVISVTILLCVYLLLSLINKYLYYSGLAIGVVIFLSTIIQGLFQSSYLPQIDGSSIDWESLSVHRISSIAAWVIVAIIVVVFIRFFKTSTFDVVVIVLSVFSIFVFSLTTLALGIQNNGFAKKPSLCVTTDGINLYSKDTNFIILILDATDSSTVKEIFDDDLSYYDDFCDFTYYEDMAGLFPYTNHSVPVILGAEPYYCENDFNEYFADSFSKSAFITDLANEDYEIQMFEDMYPTYSESELYPSNVQNIEMKFDSFFDAMLIQLKMIGLRYAPFDLKKYCEVMPNEILTNRKTDESTVTTFEGTNPAFLNSINLETTYTEKKVFKFIHTEGAHYPFIFDENMNDVGLDNSSYEMCVKASINMAKKYVDYLKTNEVYDNSVIVIMADHGCSSDRSTFKRSNPLFLVKGLYETHESLVINSAPVSFIDLGMAYNKLLNGNMSFDLFDWTDNDVRERPYLVYNSNTTSDGTLISDNNIEHEYIIKGKASNFESVVPTGKIYIHREMSLMYIFDQLYSLLGNYGSAIICLTILIMLLITPVYVWIYKNSVRMVKNKSQINRIKIQYFGDKKKLSQELSAFYKETKYKIWPSVMPVLIQLGVLMIFVNLIKEKERFYQPLEFGQLYLILPASIYGKEISVITAVLAGLSSLLLCLCLYYFDVLYNELSRINKLLVLTVFVVFSVYLTSIVPLAIVLHWIVSNIFAAICIITINAIIRPKKHIDYKELNNSKAELNKLLETKKKNRVSKADQQREEEDYKRFTNILNKHLVFYSEDSSNYKSYMKYIDEIIKHSDIPIHYVTSDPNDSIFELAKSQSRIKAYYISRNTIVGLMAKIESDVVVMAISDIENYYIRRSHARNDIEYIFIPCKTSENDFKLSAESMDFYDTIFPKEHHEKNSSYIGGKYIVEAVLKKANDRSNSI